MASAKFIDLSSVLIFFFVFLPIFHSLSACSSVSCLNVHLSVLETIFRSAHIFVWFACLLGLQLLLWHLFVCLFLPCVPFISCPNNSPILPFITPTFLSLLSCLFLRSMQNTCETAGSGIQSHWPSFLRRALWTCVHFTSYLLRIPGRYPGIVLIVLLQLIYRNISAISCYWNQDNLCEH